MNNNDDQVMKRLVSTDELINDYLDEIMGSVVEERQTLETQIEKLVFHHTPIQNGCFLIPKINPYKPLSKSNLRSQTEAILILLTNLYFLRRPLSPRLRQCFLALSEQVIDDYHAGQWIQETNYLGALSEA